MTAKASAVSKTGFRSGKAKQSIFASPDSFEGRIGVGTCGIGGRGMTDYPTVKEKWADLRTDKGAADAPE